MSFYGETNGRAGKHHRTGMLELGNDLLPELKHVLRTNPGCCAATCSVHHNGSTTAQELVLRIQTTSFLGDSDPSTCSISLEEYDSAVVDGMPVCVLSCLGSVLGIE